MPGTPACGEGSYRDCHQSCEIALQNERAVKTRAPSKPTRGHPRGNDTAQRESCSANPCQDGPKGTRRCRTGCVLAARLVVGCPPLMYAPCGCSRQPRSRGPRLGPSWSAEHCVKLRAASILAPRRSSASTHCWAAFVLPQNATIAPPPVTTTLLPSTKSMVQLS